jgi:hypothetical protein
MPRHSPSSDRLRIELVYDPTCPNVDRARSAIREALATTDAPVVWREWNRTDSSTPAALRTLGSPSVLVNGRDVGCGQGSMAQADANSCRIYRDDCGCICGAPSAELILRAIEDCDASQETA